MHYGSATHTTRRYTLKSAAMEFASSESATTTGAVGLREGDVVAWFWIGTHEEYNRFRF
jgi:hypothetical protein